MANDLSDQDFVLHQVILPLGISFITFQKIAFLIDVAGGRIKAFTLRDYLLFVMFFPQLIAGPIVHYGETMPQFHRATCRFDETLYAVGITLFCFGLFKKVVLADGMAAHVTPVFAYAASGARGDAAAVLAGGGRLHPADLLRLLGLFRHGLRRGAVLRGAAADQLRLAAQGHEHRRLLAALAHHADPLPDRLRLQPDDAGADPARGRRGACRCCAPATRTRSPSCTCSPSRRITTMLISGLWHGAGYTFILWGLLHGVYLVVNHLWRQYGPRPADGRGAGPRLRGSSRASR